MNEFNLILVRLHQFQAMVNPINILVTSSLDITSEARTNISEFLFD